MNPLTVTEFNKIVSRTLESEYILKNFYITGTITNVKVHFKTGHVYFSLKDEKATIDVVLWSSTAQRKGLTKSLEDGLLATIRGSINFYEPSGRISIIANDVLLNDKSPLQLQYEALKRELTALGYFDDAHKVPLPELVGCIGIVTSKSGAVIKDILHVAKQRNPLVKFKLFSVSVQGSDAGPTIAKGIEMADADPHVDLIIAGRGGGSMEDLWCFNDRAVVEAIYRCKKPIISAVGHETDYTLADFVADARGATPSHATEIAVIPLEELIYRIQLKEEFLHNTVTYKIKEKKQDIFNVFNRRLALPLMNLIHGEERKLSGIEQQLHYTTQQRVQQEMNSLTLLATKLERSNPLKTLIKGLGRIEHKQVPLNSVTEVTPGDDIDLFMQDGVIHATVKSLEKSIE